MFSARTTVPIMIAEELIDVCTGTDKKQQKDAHKACVVFCVWLLLLPISGASLQYLYSGNCCHPSQNTLTVIATHPNHNTPLMLLEFGLC